MKDNRLYTIIENNPEFRDDKTSFERSIIHSFSDDRDLARCIIILYRMGIATGIGRVAELDNSLVDFYFKKLKNISQIEGVSDVILRTSIIMWFESYGVETLGLLCSVNDAKGFADKKNSVKDIKLEELELPVRAYNCLFRAGIHNLGEIAELTAEELMNVRNLGKKSYQDVVQKLAEYKLCLADSIDDNNFYTVDLGGLISDLEISSEIRNALQEHNIDILKELCYSRENDIDYFLTSNQMKELVQLMQEKGISFRSDSENRFMYLYPERIKEIERKREPAWEYRLLIETAILNYNWLRKYRDQKLELWKAGKGKNNKEYLTKLLGYLQDQVDILQDYVHQLESCINNDIKESIGPRGKPGDARKIVAATEKLMFIYKSVIKWRLSFNSLYTEKEYRRVIEEFCDCIESLCENIDVFYEKLIEAKIQLDDAASGRIQHSDVHADLRIEVELRTAGMNREIEKLRQYASFDLET